MSNEEGPAASLKMSLIERLGRSFDALISRDFGKRFYKPEFLHELMDKKASVDAEMGKSFAGTFLFASIMSFFDLVSGRINIGAGLSVDLTKDLSPIIGFITASSLLRTVLLLFDLQVINQILIRLGSAINVSHMSLLFINRKASGHWNDALVPTYFGEVSGKAQHFVFNALGILMLAFVLVMLAYPSAAIITSAIDIHYSDVRPLGKFISYASVFMLMLVFVLIGCFSLRYQFLPADFDEATHEPTEHLKQTMERQFTEENAARGSSAD